MLWRGERVKFGSWQSSWLCRCDCGAEIVVPQNRLPHRESIPLGHRVDACQDCRAKPCLVCGTPIPPPSSARTCSQACKAEIRRQQSLAYYHRRAEQPGYLDARADQARERWGDMSDDRRRAISQRAYKQRLAREGREALNAKSRRQHEDRMEDPDYRERRRQKLAEYRDAHADNFRRYSRDHRRRQRALNAAKEIGEIFDDD